MSFEALASIRHIEAPGASATLLLFILAEYAGPDGCCWPSQATLSERSKLSERAVRDNLRLLEEAGLIAQERRNRKDGTRCSNRIRLTFYAAEQPAEDAATLDQHTKSAGGRDQAAVTAGSLGDDADSQRQQTPGLPAADAGLTSFEPITEPISSPPDAGESDPFERFWLAFPNKVEERAARAIFGRIVRERQATADELIAGACRYANRVRNTDPEFIKHPTTWLQREGWREPGSPAPAAAIAGSPRVEFAGPPELRDQCVAHRGEAWVVAWIDPCGWDAESRLLLPLRGIAGDRIRQELGPQLRKWGVGVGTPQLPGRASG